MFVLKDFLDAFFGPDVFADHTLLENIETFGSNPGLMIQEGTAEANMTDAPAFPTQQRETVAKRKKPGPSRTTRSRIARGWQPYNRERPFKGRHLSHLDTSKTESIRDAARGPVRGVEISLDVPNSPIELATLGAPQRSPIAPPEAEVSTGTEVDILLGNNQETTAKVSTGPSRTARSRMNHSWQPYSRERPLKGSRSLPRSIPAKQTVDTAQRTVQEAGASDNVTSLGTSHRSPVAPPEIEPNAGAEIDIPTNDIRAATTKVSRRKTPSVRFRLGRPSRRIPDQRGEKHRLPASRISTPKASSQKRPRTSSADLDLATFTSEILAPRSGSNQTTPSRSDLLSSARPLVSTSVAKSGGAEPYHASLAQSHASSTDTSPASSPGLTKKRKANLIQSDAVPSLKEFITGKDRIYERPSKRRKDYHIPEGSDTGPSPLARPAPVFKRRRNSGQSELKELISSKGKTYAPPSKRFKHRHTTSLTKARADSTSASHTETTTLDSQEIVPSHVSIESAPHQRSPVYAPESSPGSPVGEGADELPGTAEQRPFQHSADEGYLLDEPVAPTARNLDSDSTEQGQDDEFYEVETFAETRTMSPGLTYNDDDWGNSYRSPVATPESEL